jgi:ubiquinone/menaquinone biosynthesis C-methylase UbiE
LQNSKVIWLSKIFPLPPDQDFESARAAFSKQASSFDDIESHNEILQWMRQQIHAHCLRHFKTGDHILELNCGTGIDAVFFAQHGMKVHATDISEGMLGELQKKISAGKLEENITTQKCSFTDLHLLRDKKFDCIFSDFGGLNCAENIGSVIQSFQPLLKPGGTVTLVIMPPVCPWEMLLALKGNFKTAFRRFKSIGAESHLEGETFMSYYFTPSKIISAFGKEYKLKELQGLGSFVPPPYLEKFPKKNPGLFRRLKNMDEKFSHTFPFNRWADHFIITMSSNSDED